MGEMTPRWSYSEQQQLGQKLMYTAVEMEKEKAEGADEARNKITVNQLYQLLNCVIQERNEAINLLQKLITTNNVDFLPVTTPYFPADGGCDFLINPPAKAANSSITESNSLQSETHMNNYHSPVDSIFDPVSSPEFTNMNHQYYVHDSSAASFANGGGGVFMEMPKLLDRGSLIIEELSKGRVLPQKGKLLDSVRDAGPLLQTLMLAGPLPRWRNPPQMQPFYMPPAAINGGDVAASSVGPLVSMQQLGSSHNNMSDFGNVELSGMNNASFISSPVSSYGCFGLPKRQRFC